MLLKKTLSVVFLLLTASAGAIAQSTSPSPFIFPEFVKGTVLQKGGAAVEALLDYNIISQEMMFDNNGTKLVLDQDNIDTLYIQDRKFIPARQVYFEKLTNTAIPLYVQYKSTAVPPGPSDRIGGGSNQVGGAVISKKTIENADKYSMKLPEGFKLKNEDAYWLQKGGQFSPANDLKKVIKLFPSKGEQITAFVKENNIDLTSKADLIKLINFCNK
jgi:hypothetical protein